MDGGHQRIVELNVAAAPHAADRDLRWVERKPQRVRPTRRLCQRRPVPTGVCGLVDPEHDRVIGKRRCAETWSREISSSTSSSSRIWTTLGLRRSSMNRAGAPRSRRSQARRWSSARRQW